jgi:uncharacterized membrane protein YqjE
LATQETPSPGTGATRPGPGAAPPGEPSTAQLLKGIADDATTLVRQEILLARQEVTEGLASTAKASSLLAVAGVLALYGLGFLLFTIAVAIGGPDWLGFLIVTIVLFLVVAVLGLIGGRRLRATKMTPEKARAELRETAAELKEELKWARQRQQQPRK